MLGDYFGKYHIFRDPVHGFIRVYSPEREIIDTRAYQRLKRIKQLALTHYVYHGATHTRFGHSLGVMEVADKIFGIVIHKDKCGENILELKGKEEEIIRRRKLLRLVALLHDVGHAPFSHVGEELLPTRAGKSEENITHEDVAAKIIREDKEIGPIIDSIEGIGREEIAQFFEGKKPDPVIQQICMGPLDADKIDYLLRDSLFTGVHYGRFDWARLVNTMCIVNDEAQEVPTLGIEEGGKHAAEALALARFFMFQQVYFHRTRRIYDIHLSDFLSRQLPQGRFPAELEDYLDLDDAYFEERFVDPANADGENHALQALSRRKHFRCIHETSDYPDIMEKTSFQKNFEKLNNEFDHVIRDDVTNAPNRWDSGDLVFVKLRSGGKPVEIGRSGSLISKLRPIEKSRVYSSRESYTDVAKRCAELSWNMGGGQ